MKLCLLPFLLATSALAEGGSNTTKPEGVKPADMSEALIRLPLSDVDEAVGWSMPGLDASEPFFGEGGEDFPRCQSAVRVDREAEDIRRAAVEDEEMLLVVREDDAVRFVEGFGDFGERFGLRIKSEHEPAG
jgi:hypothetical protein